MLGHQALERKFIELAATGKLSHAYLFFGDAQVGKFTCALRLAHHFEFGNGDVAKGTMTECLVIRPVIEETKESIGISQARELKNFLYQLPANSKFRVAIVDEAQYLTDQAQNAILKVAEEPPPHGVLILITPNPDSLIKTLQSRFQKIYFPRVKEEEIAKWLVKEHKLSAKAANEIAAGSFGRPGFAFELVGDEESLRIRNEVKKFLDGKTSWKEAAKNLSDIDNRKNIYPFLKFLIAELSANPVKNFEILSAVTKRLSVMQETSANKRLQLEAALYPTSEKIDKISQ